MFSGSRLFSSTTPNSRFEVGITIELIRKLIGNHKVDGNHVVDKSRKLDGICKVYGNKTKNADDTMIVWRPRCCSISCTASTVQTRDAPVEGTYACRQLSYLPATPSEWDTFTVMLACWHAVMLSCCPADRWKQASQFNIFLVQDAVCIGISIRRNRPARTGPAPSGTHTTRRGSCTPSTLPF